MRDRSRGFMSNPGNRLRELSYTREVNRKSSIIFVVYDEMMRVLLARLNKGVSAEFRRRRVNDEVWLPAMAKFSGSAHMEAISEFSDYKTFAASTFVAFPEKEGR